MNRRPDEGSTCPEPQCSTLIELLLLRTAPGSLLAKRSAFTFLQDGQTVSARLSYGELGQAARSLAVHIARRTAPGEHVLLLYPPSLDFVIAFCACILAGRVVVAGMAPSRSSHATRLHHVVRDSGARLALTTTAIHRGLSGRADAALNHLEWLCSDAVAEEADAWECPPVRPADLLLVQYTSGTTGPPRGVCISHRALLANLAAGQRLMGAGSDDTGVSWLPPYHDFGLVAGIGGTLQAGSHCIQMPPLVFALQPFLWLKALSDWRARITGAPNFAWELCLRRVSEAQKQQLDLSALQIVLNGGEPVRAATLRRFADAFAPCGFRPDSFCPGYGLAESTLLLAANTGQRGADGLPRSRWVKRSALAYDRVEAADPAEVVAQWSQTEGVACTSSTALQTPTAAIERPGLERQDNDAQEFVCLGTPLPLHDAVVAGVDGRLWQAGGHIGEICIRGPSVTEGYWNAAAAPGCCEGGYLRTGDLGFVDEDGGLYITGRVAECLLLDGRRLYPQDVEAAVEDLDPALLPLAAAAFTVELERGPALVLLQEQAAHTQLAAQTLPAALLRRLHQQFGALPVAAVLMLRAGTLPRTTSGKVQRWRARELFLQQGLAVVQQWCNPMWPLPGMLRAAAPLPQGMPT